MNKLIQLFILLLPFGTIAQWNDFGIRNRITVEKRISPRWLVSLSETFTFNENVTHLSKHYTHLTARYNVTNFFSISAIYRFEQKFNYDETIDLRHKFQTDFNFKFKLKNLGIDFQERLQLRYKNINREENWNIPQFYFRPSVTLDYDLHLKVSPFISAELFINQQGYVDNLRFQAGLDYEFDKHHSLKLYYMINKEVQVKNPLTFYVLGTTYKYKF